MYFPYLYGKQRELIAIRTIAQDFPGTRFLWPVVEPVRTNSATLKRTAELCEKHGLPLYVGINPHQLDFKNIPRSDAFEWGKDFLKQLKSNKQIRPTLILEEMTPRSDLRKFIREYGAGSIGLILKATAIAPSHIAEELSNATDEVKIFIHGAEPSAGTLTALGKRRCVWVEGRFPHRSKNADYAGRHPFTDRHLTWKRSGYAGFSDFTVLPPTVSDGGGSPGAVAFHMTYVELEKPVNEVYVEHFVSDRKDQTERDNDGKMMEALAKFLKALKRSSSSFGITAAAEEYRQRAMTDSPPNLAVNKGLEVTHHMQLIHGLLDGTYP